MTTPLKYVALIAGLALLLGLIVYNGAGQILSAFFAGGPALLAIPAYMLIPLVIDTQAWQLLFRLPPSFPLLALARWVGQSVNSLLPLAQIGGLAAEARLIKDRLPDRNEFLATVIVGATMSAFSLTIFSAVGFVLIAVRVKHLRILAPLFIGTGIFVLSIGLFYLLQRHPLPARVIHVLMRPVPARVRATVAHEAATAVRVIGTIYRRRAHVWGSFTLYLLGWFLGTGEVYLALYIFGRPVSLVHALILESIAQTVRNAAFVIPGGLGVQEGAFVWIGHLLGLPAPLSLAVSLTKRFRQLVLGVPAIVTWQVHEGRRLRAS
jgi:putative membrane protein